MALLLRLSSLTTLVDNYDEGSYVASLRLMAHGAPLYGTISCGQPPLFLLSLYPWFVLFGHSIVAARLGIMVYSLIGIGAAGWIGRVLGGPRAALLAMLLLAVDPLYLTQSVAVQAEAPTLAWDLVALAAVWYARHHDRRLALLAGASFAAAVLTKLAGALAIVPILWFVLQPAGGEVLAAWESPRRLSTTAWWGALWQSIRQPLGLFAGGVGIVTVVVLAPLAPALGKMWQQVFAIRVVAEQIAGFSRLNNPRTIAAAWWELPLALLAVLVAVGGWRNRRWPIIALSGWAALSLVALALQSPLFTHHLALITPPLALLAALAPQALHRPSAWPPPAWAVRGVLLAAIVLVSFATDSIQWHDHISHSPANLVQVTHNLARVTAPGDLVVTDDPLIAVLADRNVPPNLADTSLVRMAAGMLSTSDVEADAADGHVTAILWYSGRFDQLPGLRAWVEKHFVKVADYGGGRGLFVRQPRS